MSNESVELLLQPRTFEPQFKVGQHSVTYDARSAAALESIAAALCRLDHRFAIFMEKQT